MEIIKHFTENQQNLELLLEFEDVFLNNEKNNNDTNMKTFKTDLNKSISQFSLPIEIAKKLIIYCGDNYSSNSIKRL